MLVLSRKVNQAIKIGKDIRIMFISSRGAVIRIGIEAPSDVTVLREELVPLERSRSVPARPGHRSRPASEEVPRNP
jgi:carbon storage regulator